MPSRILIVDDTRITRQQIRAFLQGIAEWDVCGEAIDGLDAIAKTRELAPDVIVLDLAMPRMNGLDAAREIRKVAPRIPILMYTTFLTPSLLRSPAELEFAGQQTRLTLAGVLSAASGHCSATKCSFRALQLI